MFTIVLFLIFINISLGHVIFNNSTFRQSPIETISFDNIAYTFYDYRVTWEEARIICLEYESELATLDVEENAIFITQQTSESVLANKEYWIGSIMDSRGFWIWTANKEKLMPNRFLQEMIFLPHYSDKSLDSDFYCLTLFRKNHNTPMFTPLHCQELRPFLCQKGELTWSEAVVQCRQKGLQIAEVPTLKEAQTLASGMLRVRPRAIENVWIGGYEKNHVWKWLPSGNLIFHNEMWNNKTMISGECLLLDRHINQVAQYLSAKCDRKRTFLCQTLVQRDINAEPIAVTVDTCPYWIGLRPLKWDEASESCKRFNATLTVLDSSITINHIVHIMIDKREQLQHIWIDGKRQMNYSQPIEKFNNGQWIWISSGKLIPTFGESFIPWYRDSDLYEKQGDCLNMDREDFDTPIVYGLSCNIEQTYICQQQTLDCQKLKEWNTTNVKINSVHINDSNVENVLVRPPQKVTLNERLFTNAIVTSKPLLYNSTVNIIPNQPDFVEIIKSFTSTSNIPRIESSYSVYNKSITNEIPNITFKPQYSAENEKKNLQTKKFTVPTSKVPRIESSYSVDIKSVKNHIPDNISKPQYSTENGKINLQTQKSTTPIIKYLKYTEISPILTTIKPYDNINIKINDERNHLIKNDTEISVRLLNNDFDNSKNNLNRTNTSIKSDININFNSRHLLPTVGFKNLSKSIINNPSKIITSSDILSNNTEKNPYIYFTKENITKIVQSSIDKNRNKFSLTTVLPTEKTTTTTESESFSNTSEQDIKNENSRMYKDSISSSGIYDDFPYEDGEDFTAKLKVPNSNGLNAMDSNGMLHLNEMLQNIFSQNSKYQDQSKAFTDLPVKNYKDNMQINVFTIPSKNDNSNVYHQRLGTRKMKKTRKNFSSKNTVQSLYNTENENNVKFNDVVNAFENNFNELNSKDQTSVEIVTDIPIALDKKYVKPWNALISRLFETLNTKLDSNDRATEAYVKNNS